MENFWEAVVIILVVVMIFTIDKTVDYYRQKRLMGIVSWSIIGDYDPALGCNSYVDAQVGLIQRTQCECSIGEKYRISNDDIVFAREIIEEYQKHINRLYFRGLLKLPKTKYHITKENYFMLFFNDFLLAHSTKREFAGHRMHSEIIDYESFGTIGEGTARYTMSDFGMLYYKLYYISAVCCNKFASVHNMVSKCDKDSIKNVLDTNQIEIIRYRL